MKLKLILIFMLLGISNISFGAGVSADEPTQSEIYKYLELSYPPEPTLWDILGIPAGSPKTVINKAFRSKLLEYHTDKLEQRLGRIPTIRETKTADVAVKVITNARDKLLKQLPPTEPSDVGGLTLDNLLKNLTDHPNSHGLEFFNIKNIEADKDDLNKKREYFINRIDENLKNQYSDDVIAQARTRINMEFQTAQDELPKLAKIVASFESEVLQKKTAGVPTKQRVESKEEKEKSESDSEEEEAPVGKYPDDRPKDREVLEQLVQQESLRAFPVGILRLILDYCKSKFESVHILDSNYNGHTAMVSSLIKLDERHFVSCSTDETIKIWELIPATSSTPAQWTCIHTLVHLNDGYPDPVSSLMKLDKKHFASGSSDGIIKIWEFIPGPVAPRCIQNLKPDKGGISELTKLDATHFISLQVKEITIWKLNPDTSQYECIQTLNHENDGHTDRVSSLTKLDATHYVSSADDEKIKIWRYTPSTAGMPEKHECIQTLDIGNSRGKCIAGSLIKLDGRHFASGDSDGIIKIWEFIPETENTVCIQTLDRANGGHIYSVGSFTKLDERHFASGSIDGTIKIWELIPETTPLQYRCIQTLITNEYSNPQSLIRMANGGLLTGLDDGKIQVFKLVVDIE